MQTKLDISCNPEEWSDLSQHDKLIMQLKAEDPVFFWEHPKMGNMKLWPAQKELLRKFNKKDKNGRRLFKELLFSAGMRSGKTAIAALIILTELKNCLMMESAQRHYDLLPKEEIVFLATASTEKQCYRTIFKKVIAFVESSPFFCSFKDEIELITGRLKFTKKNLVVLGLGSNLKSNVGLTVKVFVAEEINFTGEETYKVSPKDLYNRLSKSTTTFKPFGEDIKVAISSQDDGNDFLSKRIALTIEQKLETTLIMKKTSLEMNPNLTEADLADEKLMDEDSFYNDYGFGTRRSGSSFFKKISMDLVETWNLPNIFYGEPEFGNKMFVPDLRLDNLKYDMRAVTYGIGSDPASVGDGFGLSLGHITLDDNVILDGITVFKPEKGKEIDSTLISNMVKKIITKVPVEFYAYDIYMFNELRGELSDLGVEPIQHQLRQPDWEALKERINTNRIRGPAFKYFQREMGDLKYIRNKVNHPNGGSKDTADSVCQLIAKWDDPAELEKVIEENQILTMSNLT